MLYLFSDGSSVGKVGDGGWAFVLLDEDVLLAERSDFADQTTNNRMELSGMIQGLQFIIQNYPLTSAIEAYSDSQYVVKGMNDWYSAWLVKMASGKIIKNQDLWILFASVVSQLPNLTIKWVRGHSGHIYNERCDQLANAARKRIPNVPGQLQESKP